MRKLALALAAAFVACSLPRLPTTARGTPVLEVRGAVKGGPHVLGQADLDALPRTKVSGTDPVTGDHGWFEGVSIAEMVTERVELKRGADTAVLRTADRAAVPVPIGVLRSLRPVLADRRDAVRLPGLVLAWPSTEQRGLATDPRAHAWWAHRIVAIELVDWQRTYGTALAAPDGATDAARRGSTIFGESCITCHRLRGTGGERGPDLTQVASRMGEGKFAGLLAGHPGWRDRVAPPPDGEAETWAFLRAVAASPGPSPLDPVLPDEPPERKAPAAPGTPLPP